MQRLLIISRVVAAVSLQSKAPKAIINRGQLKSSSATLYDFDGDGEWRLLLGEFLGRFGYGRISWSGENCVNLRVKWKLRVGL